MGIKKRNKAAPVQNEGDALKVSFDFSYVFYSISFSKFFRTLVIVPSQTESTPKQSTYIPRPFRKTIKIMCFLLIVSFFYLFDQNVQNKKNLFISGLN